MKRLASSIAITALLVVASGTNVLAVEGDAETIVVEDRNIGTHKSSVITGRTWLSFIEQSQDEATKDTNGKYVNVVTVYVEEDAEKTRGAKFYHYDESLVRKPKEMSLRVALEKNFDYVKAPKDEKARTLAEKEVTAKEPVNYNKEVRLGDSGHLEDFISVTGLPEKETTYVSLILDKKTNKPLKVNNKYIYGIQTNVKSTDPGLIYFTISDKLLADNLVTDNNVGQEISEVETTKSVKLNTAALNGDTNSWSILRTIIQEGTIITQEIEEDPLVFDKIKEEGTEQINDEKKDTATNDVADTTGTLDGNQDKTVVDENVPKLAETGASDESNWYDFLFFWRYF